jgi:hypothetical protein
MALPIKSFKLTAVHKPQLGETKPSLVVAEVSYILPTRNLDIRFVALTHKFNINNHTHTHTHTHSQPVDIHHKHVNLSHHEKRERSERICVCVRIYIYEKRMENSEY